MDYRGEGAANSYNQTNVGTALEKSSSVIRDGVSYAEQTLSEVHEAIAQLEKRLETVLQPVPPQVEVNRNAQPSGPAVSHLAGRLVILNDGYQQAARRLRDLIQRVEV